MHPQLALLLLISFGSQTASFGARAGIPLVALKQGASPVMVGILLSLFSVMPLFFSISSGRLIDRIGARWPLIGGCVAQASGLLLAAAWPSIISLGIASFLVGTGHMIIMIGLNNVAGAIGRGEARVATFNRMTLVYSVGVMAGPLIAGFSLDLAGPRAPFFLLAVTQVAALFWLAASPRHVPDTRHPGAHGAGNALKLLGMRDMRRVLVISTLSPLCWELYYIFMPIYGSQIGLSASTIGAIMGSFAAAIVVLRIFMPMLQARLGSWTLLSISLAGSALAIAVMPFADSAAELAAASIAFGALVGLAYPLQMLLLYDAAPEGSKGVATGLRQTLLYAIALAAPTTLASLSTGLGFAPLMIVVSGMLGGGGAFAWRIGRLRR